MEEEVTSGINTLHDAQDPTALNKKEEDDNGEKEKVESSQGSAKSQDENSDSGTATRILTGLSHKLTDEMKNTLDMVDITYTCKSICIYRFIMIELDVIFSL